MKDSLEKAAAHIRNADAVLLAAGVEMGVDSGLTDYRGTNGIFNAYAPFAHLGECYMEITRPSHFRRNPSLAWGFWGYQMNLYRTTMPHEGFSILLGICRAKSANYFVQTTNVDGHFAKAGFDPVSIHECHGSGIGFSVSTYVAGRFGRRNLLPSIPNRCVRKARSRRAHTVGAWHGPTCSCLVTLTLFGSIPPGMRTAIETGWVNNATSAS